MKRTLLISIIVILLLTIGIGATYAQGSRNGQRGSQTSSHQGLNQQLQIHVPGTGQTGTAQTGTAQTCTAQTCTTLGTQQSYYGQQSGAGQGQQLQIHVPGTAQTGTAQTSTALGTQQSRGQGRMGRSQN